jgi:3-hydroxybutyrate dehydrogenase
MAEVNSDRDAAMRELLAVRQPSRRAIPPADVAALGVFLCGEAAANISGAALPIDGAWAVS